MRCVWTGRSPFLSTRQCAQKDIPIKLKALVLINLCLLASFASSLLPGLLLVLPKHSQLQPRQQPLTMASALTSNSPPFRPRTEGVFHKRSTSSPLSHSSSGDVGGSGSGYSNAVRTHTFQDTNGCVRFIFTCCYSTSLITLLCGVWKWCLAGYYCQRRLT
jgi:hypothetical protein